MGGVQTPHTPTMHTHTHTHAHACITARARCTASPGLQNRDWEGQVWSPGAGVHTVDTGGPSRIWQFSLSKERCSPCESSSCFWEAGSSPPVRLLTPCGQRLQLAGPGQAKQAPAEGVCARPQSFCLGRGQAVTALVRTCPRLFADRGRNTWRPIHRVKKEICDLMEVRSSDQQRRPSRGVFGLVCQLQMLPAFIYSQPAFQALVKQL